MQPVETITGVAHGGYGICRIEGQVCFVPYALPGDKVRIEITRRTKGVLWGVIEEIVEASPDRVPASCPYFGKCGGCTWQHFAYPAQSEWKRRIVRDCFERLARIETEVGWIEDAGLRLGYRTRAEFHMKEHRIGFYELGSRAVVDIERCSLCHAHLNTALDRLRGVSFGDRAIEIVVNPEGADVMLWMDEVPPALKSAFRVVERPSRKRDPGQFMFDGAPIVNGAFSQSSLLLNRMLRRVVREMAGEPDSVLDVYCGNGNFSLDLPATTRVLGLDHSYSAIGAAERIRPGCYRGGGEMAFAAALHKPWDTVIVDPPRTGALAITKALGYCDAQTIVYVSCDPATLARDLEILTKEYGWKLDRTVAIDMFPNTPHVETVCRIVR